MRRISNTRRHSLFGDPELIEAVSRHTERHIGPVDFMLHEGDSSFVHIDIHHVPPSEDRAFHTLVTSGMSEREMAAPRGCEGSEHAELFMLLPPEWKLGTKARRDERWFWPIRTLQSLARFPHEMETWFAIGHTIQHCDPPEPYGPGVRFCGSLLTHPVSAGTGFSRLQRGERGVFFYQVIPLYEEELRFAHEHGSDALVARFAQYRMSDVVDPRRLNVCDVTIH